MTIINLTDRTYTVRISDATHVTLPPARHVARVTETFLWLGRTLRGIPLANLQEEACSGLPEPLEGFVFLVTKAVFVAYPKRVDLAYPARDSSKPSDDGHMWGLVVREGFTGGEDTHEEVSHENDDTAEV